MAPWAWMRMVAPKAARLLLLGFHLPATILQGNDHPPLNCRNTKTFEFIVQGYERSLSQSNLAPRTAIVPSRKPRPPRRRGQFFKSP